MTGGSKAQLCFVDSNVWIYAFNAAQDPSKSSAANALIRSIDICLSTQVINEVCYSLIRKASFDEARILNFIEAFYQRYVVVELDKHILTSASDLRDRYNFSYWDSLIVSSALAAKADVLYSEDMHHGLIVESQLEIINPF